MSTSVIYYLNNTRHQRNPTDHRLFQYFLNYNYFKGSLLYYKTIPMLNQIHTLNYRKSALSIVYRNNKLDQMKLMTKHCGAGVGIQINYSTHEKIKVCDKC